jgi:hypothetical protein
MPLAALVLACGLLSSGCTREQEMKQADCDRLITKADGCGKRAVKAEMEKWCKANVGKKFEQGIYEFKTTGFLNEECPRLPGRLPDFNGWNGK